MSEVKHTPGDWRAIENNHGAFVVVGPARNTNRYGEEDIWDIATIEDDGCDVRSFAERRANARLIAAAPDLLSIAKRWAALEGGAWAVDRHASEKAELLADTLAAIAAAGDA